MSKAEKSMANFTILFVTFCHSVIFNPVLKRVESAHNWNYQLKNKLPACLSYTY